MPNLVYRLLNPLRYLPYKLALIGRNPGLSPVGPLGYKSPRRDLLQMSKLQGLPACVGVRLEYKAGHY
jgi:hypothetical protein